MKTIERNIAFQEIKFVKLILFDTTIVKQIGEEFFSEYKPRPAQGYCMPHAKSAIIHSFLLQNSVNASKCSKVLDIKSFQYS